MKFGRVNLLIVATSFSLTLLIAFVNSYLVNLKGAEIDAERFLYHAKEWADFGRLQLVLDAEFFIQFLGVFSSFGFEEFALTSLGFVSYYLVVSYFYSCLSMKRVSSLILTYLLFLSPTLLLRMGALLREPYVIVLLLLSTYFFSKALDGNSSRSFFIGFVLSVFAAFFHKAALALFPIYLLIFLVFRYRVNIKNLIVLIFSIIILFSVLQTIVSQISALRGAQALTVILSGDFEVAEQIVESKSSRDFRSTYDYGADWSSLHGIAMTVIRANLYYYGKPFVSDLRTVPDVLLFFENSIRILLIFYLLYKCHKRSDRRMFFCLLVYLMFNCIWALGTSNYGTGSRHHITANALLILPLFWEGKRNSDV